MQPRVILRFTGFERHHEASRVLGQRSRAYAFHDVECRAWHGQFAAEVFRAMETHRYLPVYRMADGEFAFALGPREDFLPWRRLGPRLAAKRVVRWMSGRRGQHASGSPGYRVNEVYSADERQRLLERYAADLAFIARRGFLALALDDSPFFADYAPSMLDWFDRYGVPLSADSYRHFYSVYVLLNGPDGDRLLRGRSVLVVNHLPEPRRAALDAALRARGVARAQYLSISADRAMLETLDLRGVEHPVDLVLVGAGVGAANVLPQLEPLSAPALDAGFALDLLVQPGMRWDRPFCVPDDEFDGGRVRFLGEAERRRLVAAGLGRPATPGAREEVRAAGRG
jgi:hypothetical protein